MTVWVVWDPLTEKVKAVHATEKGADEKCHKLNTTPDRIDDIYYMHENAEFEVED
jgi:hypothetical protein